MNDFQLSETFSSSRRLWMLLVTIGCWAIAGCGPSSAAHRVTREAARQTLDAVLQSWQQGEKPESWQSRDLSVVVQDFDWLSGAKLVEYEVLETKAIDANLHCQVKLLLSTEQGRKERAVTYLVGTSPVLTMFREPGL